MKKRIATITLAVLAVLTCLFAVGCKEEPTLEGTYKFYCMKRYGMQITVGAQDSDGAVYTEDYATMTINSDGTVTRTVRSTTHSGFWKIMKDSENTYGVYDYKDVLPSASPKYTFEWNDNSVFFYYNDGYGYTYELRK